MYNSTDAANEPMNVVNFFKRMKDEKKPEGRLHFSRLDAEIFFGDILEIAEDKSDIKWIAECLCGALDIAMTDRIQDIIREKPEMGKEGGDLYEIETYIEVSVE